MERAAIYEVAASENVASELLQFDSEAILSPAASARADRGMIRAVERSPLPDPWATEAFLSETLQPFDSEPPDSSVASNDDERRGQEAPELFGGWSAGRSFNWSGFTIPAALTVLVAVGVPASRWLLAPSVETRTSMTGMLMIVTNPPGLIVVIDGTPSGITPLNQKLVAGPHTVELRGAGPSRTIAVTVTAGGRAFQYLELPGAASDVASGAAPRSASRGRDD